MSQHSWSWIESWFEKHGISGARRSLFLHLGLGGKLYVLSDLYFRENSAGLLNIFSFEDLKKGEILFSANDVIFHTYAPLSEKARSIRQFGTLVLHSLPEAEALGAADIIVSKEELLSMLLPLFETFLSHFSDDEVRLRVPEAPPKALFLDRDGVVIEHREYPDRAEDVKLISELIPILHKAQRLGWLLIVVTNQSGIGRGYYNETQLQRVNLEMKHLLAQKGVYPDAILASPYYGKSNRTDCLIHPQKRKPGPSMILEARSLFNIDLSSSVMIGNRSTDLLSGYWAGLQNLILLEPLEEEDRMEMEKVASRLNVSWVEIGRGELNHVTLNNNGLIIKE